MRVTWLLALVLGVVSGVWSGLPLWADQALEKRYPPSEGTTEEAVLKTTRDRVQHVTAGFARMQLPLARAVDLQQDGVACLLEDPYLAQFNTGRQQHRFLAARLVVLNEGDQELTVPVAEMELLVDGQPFRMDHQQDQKRLGSLRLHGKHYSLNELKPAETLTVPPQGVGSTWVVFSGLDAGNDVPQLSLRIPFEDQPVYELDIRQLHSVLLEWNSERVGPAGVVAVGTVRGEFNSVNFGTILDDIVQLSLDNVARLVIHFDEQATPLDSHLAQWLKQVAQNTGVDTQGQRFSEFPILPQVLRELHLSGLDDNLQDQGTPAAQRIHETLAQAVLAAGASAYEVIPLKSLIQELRTGHPLSRAAALTYGAVRLPREMLPEVIALAVSSPTDTTDTTPPAADDSVQEQMAEFATEIQQAAIGALSDFNDPRAVSTLKELLASSDEQIREAALISLGASRFPRHQEALMDLLKQPGDLKPDVIRTLARFPRRRWAESLLEYVNDGDLEVRKEALLALNTIGHPRLASLLVELLEEENPAELRDLALNLLSQREDAHSREQVIEHALRKLNDSPDKESIGILTRFKVQRAIPRLLELLKTKESLRGEIIQSLSMIGDNRILTDLIEIYPELKPQEKATVLRTIAQIDQARFLEFARQALEEDQPQVTSAAAQLLQEFASVEAVAVLIEALRKTETDGGKINTLAQALGNLSTPESRRFLIDLRDNGSQEQRQRARAALESVYYRSPANSVYQQALQSSRTKNTTLAVRQFSLAIEIDPEYPLAYQGRAQAYWAERKHEEALADLNTLLQLDSKWPNAHSMRGQINNSLGRFEESLPDLNQAIELDSKNSGLFASRGHAYSMLERFEPAEKDYRKALELDPNNMTALTGVALSLAIKGELAEARKLLAEASQEHGDNAIFAYNSACTYARAAEYLQQQARDGNGDERKQEIIKLVDTALDELERSIKLGYTDANWTRNDPDLKMLREHQRFAQALEQMTQKGGDSSNSSPADEDAKTPE